MGKVSLHQKTRAMMCEVGKKPEQIFLNDIITNTSMISGSLLYLIEDTTVSHYSALGVHMLIGPFPFDRDNPLYFRWDYNLPDQLS